MEFPDPVIDIAVEPKTKAEQDKMSHALQKLAEEDPTFRVHTNQETGQTIIAGMGELHLEIIIDRLPREFKVEANVGKPRVAYRERPGHEVLGVRRQVRPPVRWSRSVRPCGHQHASGEAGKWLHLREQDRRRCDSQGIHPVHRQGHRKKRCMLAFSPATRRGRSRRAHRWFLP